MKYVLVKSDKKKLTLKNWDGGENFPKIEIDEQLKSGEKRIKTRLKTILSNIGYLLVNISLNDNIKNMAIDLLGKDGKVKAIQNGLFIYNKKSGISFEVYLNDIKGYSPIMSLRKLNNN